MISPGRHWYLEYVSKRGLRIEAMSQKKDARIVREDRLSETVIIRTVDSDCSGTDVADRSVHRILLSIEDPLPATLWPHTGEARKLLRLVLPIKA